MLWVFLALTSGLWLLLRIGRGMKELLGFFFASVRSEAAPHPPVTARLFETSAAFELGKAPRSVEEQVTAL